MCSSGNLDEARLLRKLRNLAKCGISGTYVNSDKNFTTSTHLKTYRYNIDHLEHITHTSLNATTFVAAYGKCGFDYRLLEDKGDTCVRVCEMSVKHVSFS